jgi:membrane protease YdiL (CAAX protease family)
MKHKSLFAYLIILALLSAAFVAGMLLAGQDGAFLAQGYMLLPAVAALLTRAFFDRQRFSDANLSKGRWTDYLKYWLFSLGISALVFVVYTILGAGRWDLRGQAFLARLSEQFAATGQDLASATPAGMTPQMMLWLFFVGGLTTFNILPGLITGFGEEFGWRGLMFPRLYAVRPWLAFMVGGLIWYVWHLPLMLVAPQQNDPQTLVILIPLLALGSICTHTYLAYVYLKTRSVFVTALAHIAMNNAQASLSYLFVVDNMLLANICLVLVMVFVVTVLAATGRFKVFEQYFNEANRKSKVTAPDPLSQATLLQDKA